MQRSLLIFSLSLTCSISLSLKAEEPHLAKLKAIQATWKKAQAKQLKQLDESYKKALLRLQTEYTKAGNLEEAIAVRDEIRRIDKINYASEQIPPKPTPQKKDDFATEVEILKYLGERKYKHYRRDGSFNFHVSFENGFPHFNGGKGIHKLRVVGNDLHINWGNGYEIAKDIRTQLKNLNTTKYIQVTDRANKVKRYVLSE